MGNSNRSELPLHTMTVREIAKLIEDAGYVVSASIDSYVSISLRPRGLSGALYPDFSYSMDTGHFGDPLQQYRTALAYVAGMLFRFQEREGLV